MPDLLAVEQHRGARQGEQQAVDHPDPARVAVQHRRQPATQAPAVELHRPGPGRRPSKTSWRSLVLQLVQGQLVVVAHEGGPLAVRADRRPGRSALASGRASARASDRYRFCIVTKSNCMFSSLPWSPPKKLACSLRGEVDLAQQHRVAGPAGQALAQRAQVGVRVGEQLVVLAHRLQQERHGVDPEAGQPDLEPEPHHLRDVVADRGVGDVQVRLVLVEVVQVVLLGLLVELPDALLRVREHRLLLRAGRRLVDPDVVVAELRVPAGARVLEPGVLVRGVVHHHVGDHPDPAVAGGPDHLDQVAVVAEARVDPVEVLDVVAVVPIRPKGRTASATGR